MPIYIHLYFGIFVGENMELTVKKYDYLCEDDKNIRQTVFVDEQKFEEEFDDIDDKSTHLVFYDGEKAVAIGRFYKGEEDGEMRVGRIAVVKEKRKDGVGKIVMKTLEDECKKAGASKIVLSAQLRAKGFYEKCGFVAFGETYFEEWCEHIKMFKDI